MRNWKTFRTFAFPFVVIMCGISAYIFVGRQFRLSNVQHDAVEQQDVMLDSLEQSRLQSILAQPYRYLDRGRQSYVFVSQDQQYVIKFFDLGRYKPGLSTLLFPTGKPGVLVKPDRMERKMNRLFSGYQLAYERDRDHAFIIFQQLKPNPLLKQLIVLNDRFGFKHTIDLSEVPFVIQYKAIPTRIVLTALLNKGNVVTAKKRLRQLLDMYMVEYGRGIYDRDHNFMYNTGFVDGEPIRLDVGRLRAEEKYKDPTVALEDLEKIAIGRTAGWLQRHFPQYRDEIISDMHLKLEQLQG